MGSHLSRKNLKRLRKIIGTPEVGLFPGNIRLVFRVYKVAVSIGLFRVVAYDRSRVRFLQSFDHRTSYLRWRRSRHIDDQPTEINVKKETRRLLCLQKVICTYTGKPWMFHFIITKSYMQRQLLVRKLIVKRVFTMTVRSSARSRWGRLRRGNCGQLLHSAVPAIDLAFGWVNRRRLASRRAAPTNYYAGCHLSL